MDRPGSTSTEAARHGSRLIVLGAIAVVLAAILLRLSGLGFLLPQEIEPDALVYLREVLHLQGVPSIRDPRAFVESLEGDYAVVVVYENWGRPLLGAIRRELRALSAPVARFIPDAEDLWRDLPLQYQDDLLHERIFWAWRVLQARCVGPVIEIYALRTRTR